MKGRSLRWWGVAGLAGLAGLCLLAGVFYYFSVRVRTFYLRPLVLIHNPVNHDRVGIGENQFVHATARSQAGIRRMELWADDVLVAERQAEQGSLPTSMVLAADWMATDAGEHRLVVRATSGRDVDGQSSIGLEAENMGQWPAGAHLVQEGETLESIASDYGTTPEELADLNPGLDPGGLSPGDELTLPDDQPPAAGSDALPTGEGEAPDAVADAPDSFTLFTLLSGYLFPGSGEPTGLHLELISLRTGTSYEGLHCYVGLAGAPPLWYPDQDGDQSTDESFTILSGTGGEEVSWDVGQFLSGDRAPVLTWPSQQPLPVDISCVGITSGGMEALELGHSAFTISPEQWDGIVRFLEVSGAEGSYVVGYRVTGVSSEPHGEPKGIDPAMASPTDLVVVNYNAVMGPEVDLDEPATTFLVTENDPYALLWKYTPNPGEDPIVGFRVYLNGNLQWTDLARRRYGDWYYTIFPPQWRHPPCGEQYVLTVSAWRPDPSDADGMESYAAVPPITFETPDDECDHWIRVSFDTLETFDLGNDGQHESRTGDVGPPYGTFYVNDQEVSFDTGTLDRSVGSLDMPIGLESNYTYSLANIAADPEWQFNGRPIFIIPIQEGESVDLGMRIMDEDSGLCNSVSTRGCDNLVCEISVPGLTSEDFSHFHEESQDSENGHCRLTYSYGPASGSPVDLGGGGLQPLPWIDIEKIVVDEGSGAVHVHVRNTGSAAWTMPYLQIELRTRTGEHLHTSTLGGLVIGVGRRAVLEQYDMHVDRPYDDVCALIDPDDMVLEENEQSGLVRHTVFCPDLPDLTITNAVLEGDSSGHLRVTVQNIGNGPLENHTISLNAYLPDGSPTYAHRSWPNISLDVNQARSFDLYVTESVRTSMQDGYMVIVNEDPLFAESDITNNSYITATSAGAGFAIDVASTFLCSPGWGGHVFLPIVNTGEVTWESWSTTEPENITLRYDYFTDMWGCIPGDYHKPSLAPGERAYMWATFPSDGSPEGAPLWEEMDVVVTLCPEDEQAGACLTRTIPVSLR
jgi:LysM repeat protein